MNVAALLAPITVAQFVGEYWEQRPLHVKRVQVGYYDAIVARRDLEEVLFGNGNLTLGHFKVYKGREELGAGHWSDVSALGDWASNVVSAPKLLSAMRQGYSVHLNFPERVFPPVRRFLCAIEEELKLKAQSHLIISPPRAQGFLPHTDPHGVLVLQLSGAKRWHSYGVVDATPRSHGVNHHELASRSPSQTFDVEAGDLLYLPRGTAHSAATGDAHSVHLSLMLIPPRGLDLMHLLEASAELQAFFQTYVPSDFGVGDEARQAYARQFKKHLSQLIECVDVFELIEQHYQATRASNRSFQPLTDLFEIEEVTLDARVRVVAGLRLSHDPSNDTCSLTLAGVSLRFPGRWHQGLAELLATREFAVCAIGGSLRMGDAERLQVARNLLHAAFLERLV